MDSVFEQQQQPLATDGAVLAGAKTSASLDAANTHRVQAAGDSIAAAAVSKKPKRHQVSRACQQCRKQHAACDNQRPCSRCVRQNIAHECVDAPRRARAKRETGAKAKSAVKAERGGSTSVTENKVNKGRRKDGAAAAALGDAAVANAVLTPSELALLQAQAAAQAAGLVGTPGIGMSPTPSDLSAVAATYAFDQDQWRQQQQQQQLDGRVPLDIANPSEWNSAYSTLFQPATGQPERASVAHEQPAPPVSLPSAYVEPVTAVPGTYNRANGDLPPDGAVQYFWEQISQLRQQNAELMRQLSEVASEVQTLGEAAASPMPPTVSPQSLLNLADLPEADQQDLSLASGLAGAALNKTAEHLSNDLNWYEFGQAEQDAADVPVSVWQSSPVACDNILVECNEAFVSLIGLPIEILRAGFTCRQLMTQACSDAESTGRPLCQQQWLRRVQINTMSGLQDVLVSITPVQNLDEMYFVIHFLNAS